MINIYSMPSPLNWIFGIQTGAKDSAFCSSQHHRAGVLWALERFDWRAHECLSLIRMALMSADYDENFSVCPHKQQCIFVRDVLVNPHITNHQSPFAGGVAYAKRRFHVRLRICISIKTTRRERRNILFGHAWTDNALRFFQTASQTTLVCRTLIHISSSIYFFLPFFVVFVALSALLWLTIEYFRKWHVYSSHVQRTSCIRTSNVFVYTLPNTQDDRCGAHKGISREISVRISSASPFASSHNENWEKYSQPRHPISDSSR